MRHLILFAFVTMLWPVSSVASDQDATPVFPQQMTASQLKFYCAASSLTSKGRLRRRYCVGFISGVEEGLRVYQLRHPSETPALMCVPTGTSSKQMSEVFIRYAARKGVELEQPAAAVVIEALAEAYACPPPSSVSEQRTN